MQKVASANTPTLNKEKEMNKQASIAGKALADALLEKLANIGDQTTTSGIPEGVAPNKNQIDNAGFISEQDSYIKPLPTGNGIINQGSINQIMDAIVADAASQGATNYFNNSGTNPISPAEGNVEGLAVPNQVSEASPEVEKVAAVMSLVNSGIDFDSAVSLVKEAADQIEAEEISQIKEAAMSSLLEQGVDFDLALALVKSASDKENTGKALSRGGRMYGRGAAEGIGGMAAGGVAGAGIGAGIGALAKNTGAGAAIGAGVGALSGALAGQAHGMTKSVRNQFKEETGKPGGNALRAYGRGALEGVGGGLAGLAVGAAARKPILGSGLSQAGTFAGSVHGFGRSIQNQLGEHVAREKKAALDALCYAGVDFETAAGLVQAKSQELYGA